MRAQLSGCVVDFAIGKSHGFGSVQQQAFGHQVLAFVGFGGSHEARFHFNGDHPHVLLNTACGGGHHNIKQCHDRAAMRDVKGVEMLGTRFEMQLRLTVFKLLKCEAEVGHKWDVDTKWNAHAVP